MAGGLLVIFLGIIVYFIKAKIPEGMAIYCGTLSTSSGNISYREYALKSKTYRLANSFNSSFFIHVLFFSFKISCCIDSILSRR